jgi:flavodoxin I
MKILILFSTMMGTTEEVAKRIQKNLMASGNQIDLYNVFDNPEIDFAEYDVLIMGAPTYDEGLEINMKQYIDQQNPNLSKQKIAIFGLGDKMYPQYCTSVDILEKWVTKNSGKLSIESLRIDGYPLTMAFIDGWAKQISNFFIED